MADREHTITLTLCEGDFEMSMGRKPCGDEEFEEWARLCEKGLLNGHIDWDILFECAKDAMRMNQGDVFNVQHCRLPIHCICGTWVGTDGPHGTKGPRSAGQPLRRRPRDCASTNRSSMTILWDRFKCFWQGHLRTHQGCFSVSRIRLRARARRGILPADFSANKGCRAPAAASGPPAAGSYTLRVLHLNS